MCVCWCVDKTKLSSATRRRNSASRPQTSRSGIIAARHQRVLSAKKARQQSADDAERTRPGTAAVRRPWTAAGSGRPGTAAVRGEPTLASSSMDTVTFESERRRVADRPSTVTPPRSASTVLNIDDDEYTQVTLHHLT